jgi:hypothetical protein
LVAAPLNPDLAVNDHEFHFVSSNQSGEHLWKISGLTMAASLFELVVDGLRHIFTHIERNA